MIRLFSMSRWPCISIVGEPNNCVKNKESPKKEEGAGSTWEGWARAANPRGAPTGNFPRGARGVAPFSAARAPPRRHPENGARAGKAACLINYYTTLSKLNERDPPIT